MTSQTFKVKSDLFLCDICANIPVSKIYQCVNGHILCAECKIKVGSTCPQCRVVDGTTPIRNLSLEKILDAVDINCSFRNYGCLQSMQRHELAAHHKLCEFRTVSICRSLGFENCQVEVSSGKALTKHLQEAHRVTESTRIGKNQIGMWDFLSFQFQADSTNSYMWRQTFGEHSTPFLVLVKIVKKCVKSQELSCAVLYLGDISQPRRTTDYLATVEVSVYHQRKVTSFSKTINVMHFKAAEDEREIPYFKMPINCVGLDANQGLKFDLLLGIESAAPSNINDADEIENGRVD